MNRRKMKRELFGFLAVYLDDFPLSDLSHQMESVILGDNPTDAHRRRYQTVRQEVIDQMVKMAYKNPYRRVR